MEQVNMDEEWGMTPDDLVRWAKVNVHIFKPNEDLTYDNIRRAIRWIGNNALDTLFLDGDKPILGRLGVGVMLFVTIMVFPAYYARYELWQRN
jgi:hypothetical protein